MNTEHDTQHRAWSNSHGGQWVLEEDIPDDPVKCACGWVWTEADRADNYPPDYDPWAAGAYEAYQRDIDEAERLATMPGVATAYELLHGIGYGQWFTVFDTRSPVPYEFAAWNDAMFHSLARKGMPKPA